MGIALNLRRTVIVAASILVLAACASPANIKTGEQESAAVARVGKPTLEFPRPGGGKHLVYATAPSGQFAWGVDVDTNGKVVASEQILTSPHFDTIDDGLTEGKWNTDRLRYEFGPPARISRVGLHGEQIVWEYRFRENGVWNSLMYVYVTPQGIVTRFHPGPDPAFEADNFMMR
jgi:hypothetical protein